MDYDKPNEAYNNKYAVFFQLSLFLAHFSMIKLTLLAKWNLRVFQVNNDDVICERRHILYSARTSLIIDICIYICGFYYRMKNTHIKKKRFIITVWNNWWMWIFCVKIGLKLIFSDSCIFSWIKRESFQHYTKKYAKKYVQSNDINSILVCMIFILIWQFISLYFLKFFQ